MGSDEAPERPAMRHGPDFDSMHPWRRGAHVVIALLCVALLGRVLLDAATRIEAATSE